MNVLDRYKEACNFPGPVDTRAIEKSLAAYCNALGVKRNIVKIERGWDLSTYPELITTMYEVLADFEKRTGRKPMARDASDALDARDARAAREVISRRLRRP